MPSQIYQEGGIFARPRGGLGAVESITWATLVMSILGVPGREGNRGKIKDSSGPSPQGAFCSDSEEHSYLSRGLGPRPQPPPGPPISILVGRREAAGRGRTPDVNVGMTRDLMGFTAQVWKQQEWGDQSQASSLGVKCGQVTWPFCAALWALRAYTGVIMKHQ